MIQVQYIHQLSMKSALASMGIAGILLLRNLKDQSVLLWSVVACPYGKQMKTIKLLFVGVK